MFQRIVMSAGVERFTRRVVGYGGAVALSFCGGMFVNDVASGAGRLAAGVGAAAAIAVATTALILLGRSGDAPAIAHPS